MRYTCGLCGSFVKDKFFFGLLHLCLTPEQRAAEEYRRMWGIEPGSTPPPQQLPEHLDASTAILELLQKAGRK